MTTSAFASASAAQRALAHAIKSGNADAILSASSDFARLIDAASQSPIVGNPALTTDIRQLAALRAEIVTTHRTLNLLRDATARRADRLALIRGRPAQTGYRHRPAA